MSSIRKLIHELKDKLPNDFRPTTLRDKEILAKSQNFIQTWPRVQSSLEKEIFSTGAQKMGKIRYQNFSFFYNFV